MGHATANTTAANYLHLYDETRLGTGQNIVDAIIEARRAVRANRAQQASHGGCASQRRPVDPRSRKGIVAMERTRIERATSWLQTRCSPS
jgi:hypothetical protein